MNMTEGTALIATVSASIEGHRVALSRQSGRPGTGSSMTQRWRKPDSNPQSRSEKGGRSAMRLNKIPGRWIQGSGTNLEEGPQVTKPVRSATELAANDEDMVWCPVQNP